MIKNDKQSIFNQIKGEITEVNRGEEFSSITLVVGRNNVRHVNLSCKTMQFDLMIKSFSSGDKVIAQFYISSNKKNDRWYTTGTLLSLTTDC
jgi:molybdopterin-binding protein